MWPAACMTAFSWGLCFQNWEHLGMFPKLICLGIWPTERNIFSPFGCFQAWVWLHGVMSACKCREDRSPFPRINNYAHRDNPSSFFRMHSKRPRWYKHCLVFSLTPNWSLKVSFHKDPILSLVPYSMTVSLFSYKPSLFSTFDPFYVWQRGV